MRALGVFARFPGVPGEHVAGGADGPLSVEDWDEGLLILEIDCLLNVFCHGAHLKCDYNSPTQVIIIEERRGNFFLIALFFPLAYPNYFGGKIFTIPFSSRFYLFFRFSFSCV